MKWLQEQIRKIRASKIHPTQNSPEDEYQHRCAVLEAWRNTEAYKVVLDLIEGMCDESLADIRVDTTHDPQRSMALQIRWREREQILLRVQEEVMSAIRQRKTISPNEEGEETSWPLSN